MPCSAAQSRGLPAVPVQPATKRMPAPRSGRCTLLHQHAAPAAHAHDRGLQHDASFLSIIPRQGSRRGGGWAVPRWALPRRAVPLRRLSCFDRLTEGRKRPMHLPRRTALGLLAAAHLPAAAQTRPWPSRAAALHRAERRRRLRGLRPHAGAAPVGAARAAGGGGQQARRQRHHRHAGAAAQPARRLHLHVRPCRRDLHRHQRLSATCRSTRWRTWPPSRVAVTSPLVWLVNPGRAFRTLAGDGRAGAGASRAPGATRLPASGSIPHLVMEDFKLRHRLDLPAVPYRSTPQSLIGGDRRRGADHAGQPRRQFRPYRRRPAAGAGHHRARALGAPAGGADGAGNRPRQAGMGRLVRLHGAEGHAARGDPAAERR